MLLFLYIYGTNIGICNSGVGKMKHPAFIFVLTKKEVLMVSVELKQEKHNALVSFLMIVIAVLFLLYMGSSLVHSTKAFWENYSIEEAAGIEGIQVKSLPLSAKHIADDTLFYRNRKLTLDCRIACRGYA